MKCLKIFFIHIFIIYFLFNIKNLYATQLSEDLTLSRIYVEPGNLEPEFSETRDYYTLLLTPDVTNLIVQATPTNENLKYEINENDNLKEGENLITITVYSKDNSKNKIYTINALKTNEPDKYNALLSTLIVDNHSFNEDFFPEKFNYTTKNSTNDNKIEIFAYPQNPNATVEIKGIEYNIKINKENNIERNINNINSSNNTFLMNNNISTNSDFKRFTITSILITIILLLILFILKKIYKQ